MAWKETGDTSAVIRINRGDIPSRTNNISNLIIKGKNPKDYFEKYVKICKLFIKNTIFYFKDTRKKTTVTEKWKQNTQLPCCQVLT